MTENLNTKAQELLAMHNGEVLVLPNAWDPASAALIEREGARAIATTSCGVSWSLGKPDGQGLRRSEMVAAVARIAAAVDIPVTADVENGYGPQADDVAATVRAVAEAGGVGINLEDSGAPASTLFGVEEQSARIGAARQAAADAGVPDLVINARADVYLAQVGDPADRLGDVVRRGEAYAAAGADCFFVPGLLDLEVLREVVSSVDLPVNALAMPGGPSVAEFADAGVRRVSVGGRIAEIAYTAAVSTARELLAEGTYGKAEGALTYPEMNALFTA